MVSTTVTKQGAAVVQGALSEEAAKLGSGCKKLLSACIALTSGMLLTARLGIHTLDLVSAIAAGEREDCDVHNCNILRVSCAMKIVHCIR